MAARLKRISLARWLMLQVLTMGWVLTSMSDRGDVIRTPHGLARLIDLGFLLHPFPWALLGVLYWTATLAFTLRIRESLAGVTLVAIHALLGSIDMSVRDDMMPPLITLVCTDVVGAWTLGRFLARKMSAPERDAFAHELVCGVLGAMFCLSGVAKLRHAGLDWIDGPGQAVRIYERADSVVLFVTDIRLWLTRHPTICAAGSAFTLTVETSGFLFAWRPARRVYGWLVLAMFSGMGLSLGLFEDGFATLPVALAYSTFGDRVPKAAAPSSA